MIFHVLELKLSQRYVGVYVWLWKVHPFQVNLQISWIWLKQKKICKMEFWIVHGHTCLFVKPKLSNLTWQYCSSTGNLRYIFSDRVPTLFKRPIAYMQTSLIHWKPDIHFPAESFFIRKTYYMHANTSHPLEIMYAWFKCCEIHCVNTFPCLPRT